MEKGSQKQVNVLDTLYQAVLDSALLEVTIDNEEKRYGARLLGLSEDPEQVKKQAADAILAQYAARLQPAEAANNRDGPTDARWILITPLEPIDGNMKIRKAAKITLGFYRGLEQYRVEVAFRKVQRVETGQAIELSWPAVIHSMPMRLQHRVEIPDDMDLTVQVQKRGEEPFIAKIVDISSGGLSFTCQEGASSTLVAGDKVGLTIRGEILIGTPITTYGSVSTLASARDRKDVQVTRQLYGVQFKLLSVADAMTVDRLVKAVQTNQKNEGRTTRKKISL
ncbi:MAG: PilZ domain-containing protein [Magnetococcus sp. YQC-5]